MADVPREYEIVTGSSTVIVEARSSVGPIVWEGLGPRGSFRAQLDEDGHLLTDQDPEGHLELDLRALTSGNKVYDAELQRRLDARRYPTARVELASAAPLSSADVQASAMLTMHGVTRTVSGTLTLEARPEGAVLVTGEQRIDIRDFGLEAPTMLMLKIYPDVKVHLVVEGRPLT